MRHPVLLGRAVLRKRDAPFGLDRFQPQRAVRSGARQNDSDCLIRLIVGQRTKELIDGPVSPACRARPEL